MGSRFLYDNRAIAAAASIVVTSEELSANPSAWLKYSVPSYVWRSKIGHTVYDGFNDRIDLRDDAGVKAALLTLGNYATPALYAAMVQAALNAASSSWTVVYSSATHKYSVARGAGAVAELLWLTGTNTLRSAGRDLGFDVSADDVGAMSYLADAESYHSRHGAWFDLAAAASIGAAVAHGHNLAGAGTIRVDGGSSVLAAAGAVGTVSAMLSLVGGPATRWNAFGPSSQRYWRLLIDDVANPLGYSELSVPYVGPVLTLERGRALPFEDSPAGRQLSEIREADQGAHFVNRKASGGLWPVRHVMPGTDRDGVLALFAATLIGGSFFWSPRTSDDVLRYVHTREGPRMPNIPSDPEDQWEWQAELLETIG